MLTHNVKLAFRNLFRHKTFSFINILGLTVGLAGCIFIGLYAYNELSFDRFHVNHQHIYRINKITNEKGKQESINAITPGQLSPALPAEIPGIVSASRFRPWFNDMLVSYDTLRIKLADVAYADAAFLQMFDFRLTKGDQRTALSEPFAAVLTETTAKRYFNDESPIGKTLVTLNDIAVRVTGVMKDVPVNSSMQFNMLISWPTINAPSTKDYFFWMDNWTTQVNFSFVQLKPGSSAARVSGAISDLLHRHLDEKEYQYRIYLQPLDDIHLQSGNIMYAESFRTNSGVLVNTLLVIAGFILLIACFNFINLSTAGALARAKETGIQKLLGAQRLQLIGKFFSESFVLCLLSLASAVILVFTLMPYLNGLTGSSLNGQLLFEPQALMAMAGLLLIISVFAGLYPALFLSRFKSVDVFRNMIKAGRDSWVRKSFVTTQFVISILLIVATIVVNRQMKYIGTKDLGFDREQVVIVPLTNTGLESKSSELITALKKHPGIDVISATNRVPGQSFNGYGIVPEGHTLDEHMLSDVLETDADFLNVYNIKLAKGRFFSPQMPTDTTDAVVINEAMARYLNWTDPIGKNFEVYEERKAKVIGVIKDINTASLRQNVQPLTIILKANPLYLSIRIKPGSTESSLSFLQKTWKQFEQKHPFDYFFLDEQMNRFYQSDNRLLKVLSIFAALAICIACMGLFGLSIYTAQQRTKEIGIRKVLGAKVSQVTILLSRDFLKLIVLAAVIAFPAGWWAMDNWLNDFAYRTDISWWIFIVAGLLVATIALVTLSFQAIKAALANPIDALRNE